MLSTALDHLREIREMPWEKVTLPKLLGTLTAIALVLGVYLVSEDGWVPLLDSLNLVFHEAGHPLFSPFGETLHILGGTLMQLLVPFAVLVTCWHKRQAIGAALAGTWLFQNGFNIARCMADAREQALPLVGGGEHDWATLFGNWGVLPKDLAYAATVRHLAWVGILACSMWLVWRWFRER